MRKRRDAPADGKALGPGSVLGLFRDLYGMNVFEFAARQRRRGKRQPSAVPAAPHRTKP